MQRSLRQNIQRTKNNMMTSTMDYKTIILTKTNT